MALVKFLSDDTIMDINVLLEGHRVVLVSPSPITTITPLISAGFLLLNEHNQEVMSDFSGHRYLYHEEIENYRFIITDDPNDIKMAQPPVVQAPEPTLEEVKEKKIAEMENAMDQTILTGVLVTLEDGSRGLFGLSVQNQTSLTALRVIADKAENRDTPSIPWHISDDSANCRYFSPAEIIRITDAAIEFMTYHITFFRDLRIYINSLMTKKDVEEIIYDLSSLPKTARSKVLNDVVKRMNKSVS